MMADLVAVLREILSELRGLRSDFRRRAQAPDLIAAIESEFGPARFTASGLLEFAADDPDGAIAVALKDMIDPDASPRSRTTALGILLRKLREVEIVAEQRGC